MAEQVARQDATSATYFSFDRFVSGSGQDAVEDGDELSGILVEELPDLTVGRPFAAAFAVGQEWGHVVELGDVDVIYDQPDGPGALLLDEFDSATLADRIEQLPGGDFGLGREGSLAASGDRRSWPSRRGRGLRRCGLLSRWQSR